MTSLYTLTSFMMLHEMASLQLIYLVTHLFPTFIYLLFVLLGACYILQSWNSLTRMANKCQLEAANKP